MAGVHFSHVEAKCYFGLGLSVSRVFSFRLKSCRIDATSFRVGTRCNGPFSNFLGFSLMEAPVTLTDIATAFSTDEKCRELLERLRWPAGPECPRCHTQDLTRISTNKKLLWCADCKYTFTVTAGTIFNDSHLPLETWFFAVVLLVEARKGMSAMQLRRTLWGQHKGSYKTAWYLCHRIRAAMALAERPILDGTVEMDETYVGGKQRNRGRGRATTNKEVVIGIRQRSGELRFFHAEDAKSGTLARYIQENISSDVDVIVTDELP